LVQVKNAEAVPAAERRLPPCPAYCLDVF